MPTAIFDLHTSRLKFRLGYEIREFPDNCASMDLRGRQLAESNMGTQETKRPYTYNNLFTYRGHWDGKRYVAVDQLNAQGRALAIYVQREFDDYLKCGRVEYGFLRVRCQDCHAERLVGSVNLSGIQATIDTCIINVLFKT